MKEKIVMEIIDGEDIIKINDNGHLRFDEIYPFHNATRQLINLNFHIDIKKDKVEKLKEVTKELKYIIKTLDKFANDEM